MSPGDTSPPAIPAHWTPEQALAFFECLHAMRQALWTPYGPQVQQAWRAQLVPTERLRSSTSTSRSDAASAVAATTTSPSSPHHQGPSRALTASGYPVPLIAARQPENRHLAVE